MIHRPKAKGPYCEKKRGERKTFLPTQDVQDATNAEEDDDITINSKKKRNGKEA